MFQPTKTFRFIPQVLRAAGLVGAGALAVALMSPGDAVATGQSTLRMPYTARLLDDIGLPVDGQFDLSVQVLDGEGNLLHEESFPNHVVSEGSVTLILGAGLQTEGVPLDADLVAGYPGARIQVLLDGDPIGPLQQFGQVPHALVAQRVPAAGVQFGEEHGVIPAGAVEEQVQMVRGYYGDGDRIDGLPDRGRWSCEHSVSLASPGFVHDWSVRGKTELYAGHVGTGSINPAPDLVLQFDDGDAFDNGGDSAGTQYRPRVHLERAWSTCSLEQWGVGCNWDHEPAGPSIRAAVTSFCVRF